jgi:hypothetical protein
VFISMYGSFQPTQEQPGAYRQQDLMRLIIHAHGVAAPSDFLVRGFEELCHNVRHWVIIRNPGRSAVRDSSRSPQDIDIIHRKLWPQIVRNCLVGWPFPAFFFPEWV